MNGGLKYKADRKDKKKEHRLDAPCRVIVTLTILLDIPRWTSGS